MSFENYCDICFESSREGCFSMSKSICRKHYNMNKEKIQSLEQEVARLKEENFNLKEERKVSSAKDFLLEAGVLEDSIKKIICFEAMEDKFCSNDTAYLIVAPKNFYKREEINK